MNTQTIIKNKKQCSKCKTWKEIEQFGKQTESSTGLCSWCKDCRRNNLSEYRKTAQGKTTNNKYNNKRREIVESKEYQQIYRLKKFNLLVEEYENLLKGQDNQCAICKKEFIKTPHIDHNHITEKVRGLLCADCNHGLGCFKDNLDFLNNAINYLVKNQN